MSDIPNVLGQGADLVSSIAVISKRVFMKRVMENAQEYAETESMIADVTKGVSVVCSRFQLISVGLDFTDPSSSRSEHFQSTTEIVGYHGRDKRIHDKRQSEAVLQGCRGQEARNSYGGPGKDVDVLTAVEVMKVQKNQGRTPSKPRQMPRLTPIFVGRDIEMNKLKQILDVHGSAAIMQYGGSGKTQLMIVFAERAESQGWVSGGSFWVPAHGNDRQFLQSFASFTESLSEVLLIKEERKDFSVVLATFKRVILSRNAMYLIYIDNADYPRVNSMLGETVTVGTSQK